MCERAGSQDPGVLRNRQLIKYVKELEKLDETLLFLSDGIQSGINLHDRGYRKNKSVVCPSEHPSDRSELILGKEITSKYIRRELNSYLSDVL
jgi:hypothetical protein